MPTKPTSAKLTKLTKLRPHPDNYRRHTEAQLDQLCASIENAGFYRNIVACKDGTILAGHGAVLAAERLGMTDVPVVFIDAEPTSREALKVLVGDNWISNLAEDDEALLAATLKSLEADDALDGTGFSTADLEALREAVIETGEVEPETDETYTMKMEPPTYKVTGDCPDVADLLDTSKTDELLAAIEAADLPEDLRAYLRAAAYRHNRFHYGRAAEFYAHAEPAIQRLMEQSALVVVDFDDAIASGFVHTTKRLLDLAPELADAPA